MGYYKNGYKTAYNRTGYTTRSTSSSKIQHPVLDRHYDAVIHSNRDTGTCRYCGTTKQSSPDGNWYAGVTGGTWYTVCPNCATSDKRMIEALMAQVNAKVEGVEDATPVMALVAPATAALQVGDTLNGIRGLLAVLTVADELLIKSRFRGLPTYEDIKNPTMFDGTCCACQSPTRKDVDVAIKRGGKWYAYCLRCATTSAEERRAEAAAERDAHTEKMKALVGLHRIATNIYKVDENGKVSLRKGRRFFPVRDMPPLSERTLMDQEAATAYGRETGRCCNCGESIGHGASRQSVAVGYGPVCASRHGWFFPSPAEAEEILLQLSHA